MGAFTHSKIIDLTLRTADEWELWHYPDFRDLKDVGKGLQSLGVLAPATTWLNPDPNGVITSEVNKITYLTPDYMLSNAQDYRKGEKGYQQHIWQATLDPYAVVFATNPNSLREDDRHRPSYWASHGRLPRTAQHRNVLVALHSIPRYPSPSIMEARHYAFTHAYFPKWAFDQVVELPAADGGGWIFGRRGDGYVALYSHQPYEWQTEGPDAGQEIVALGRKNAWIVQMGRAVVDGPFEAFVRTISEARLEVCGLQVAYDSPGNGRVSVACPATVKTPILKTWTTITKLQKGKSYPDLASYGAIEADHCARVLLRGVARNRAIIPIGLTAHLLWRIYRVWPRLAIRISQAGAAAFQRTREQV